MRLLRSYHLRLLVPLLLVCAIAAVPRATAQPMDAAHLTTVPVIHVKETIVAHPHAVRLNDTCRSSWDVLACTDFLVERFDCRCEPGDDGWRIVADVDLEAVIHVVDVRYLGHEHLHLADIHNAIPRELAPYLSMRFKGERGCRTLARVISSPQFTRAVLNRIRIASNVKYGCETKQAAIGKERTTRARRDAVRLAAARADAP